MRADLHEGDLAAHVLDNAVLRGELTLGRRLVPALSFNRCAAPAKVWLRCLTARSSDTIKGVGSI